MTCIRARIIGILARHAGEWIDNGNPDKTRCASCGHRPILGELHQCHVADDLIEQLGLTAEHMHVDDGMIGQGLNCGVTGPTVLETRYVTAWERNQ